MSRPVLVAVHEQAREREALQRELSSRYAADYEIVCEDSALSALGRLEALRTTASGPVLVVFAAETMTSMGGLDFLERARELHPRAQRVLLLLGLTGRRRSRS